MARRGTTDPAAQHAALAETNTWTPRLGVVHCRAGVVDRLVRDTFSVVGVSGWCVVQRSATGRRYESYGSPPLLLGRGETRSEASVVG